jgi:methylated-DNA-[protein]-cysteine S-methyltransferase
MQQLEYSVFETVLGWVGILVSGRGLLATTLPQPTVEQARHQLGTNVDAATWSPHRFNGLMSRLRSYFCGGEVAFPDKLDLTGATNFEREVWVATRLIPYGETRSYLWVARQIGRPGAARAVGQALGKNPLPIIVPCHRVIASNGGLGGFGGGLKMKRRLLVLESATTV